MEPTFVNIWGWVGKFRSDAYHKRDAKRIRLTQLFDQAWDLFETAPERSLALCNEGVQLATQLREPCWILFYKYWQCETYLFYLSEGPAAMKIAVKLVVQIREPKYEHCPIRARIYRILVDAYLFTDSIGYTDQITRNLDHLENEVPLDKDTWQLIECRRSELALDAGQYTEALKHAQIYLLRAQDDDFRLANAYWQLCRITYKLDDLPTMFENAKNGELHARRCNRLFGISDFQVWQAVYHQSSGAKEIARRLTRTAIRRAAILHNPFCPDSLCAYYEKCGELDRSLRERHIQLADAVKSGNIFEEAHIRLLCCQLLLKMGKPFKQDVLATRQSILELRKPERFLGILDRLSEGRLDDF